MQFKWQVILVVGYKKYMFLVATLVNPLDDRTLIGVENIHLVPLKKNILHRDPAAGNDIAGPVFRVHAVAFHADKKIRTLEVGNHVIFAFVIHNGDFTGQKTRHRADRY